VGNAEGYGNGLCSRESQCADVRYGSKADIASSRRNVRLPPKADMDQHGRDVRFVKKTEAAAHQRLAKGQPFAK